MLQGVVRVQNFEVNQVSELVEVQLRIGREWSRVDCEVATQLDAVEAAQQVLFASFEDRSQAKLDEDHAFQNL